MSSEYSTSNGAIFVCYNEVRKDFYTMQNKIRWDFLGLSTETKPTAKNENVTDGSTYFEVDTSKMYVWYKNQWYEIFPSE